jgi:hypothetical protein
MGTMLPSPSVWIVSPVAANANNGPVGSAQVTGSTWVELFSMAAAGHGRGHDHETTML